MIIQILGYVMKTTIKFFSAILFLLIIASCNNPTSPFSGKYNYTAYDSLGTKIVLGTFTLNFKDANNLSGEWNFYKVGNPKNLEHILGNGVLKGTSSEGKLMVELNPNFVDNNFELIGTINSETISGKWNRITFFGITSTGRFEAVTF